MILLTGATGQIGRELVGELSAGRVEFRALVRSAGKAETIREAGGEAVVGDYGDPRALAAALSGVHTLFLLTPTIADKAVVEGRIGAEAARAGASRVVKISAMGADALAPPIFLRLHRDAERRIEEIGLARTYLRPSFFMQNSLMFTDTIRSHGAIFAPAGAGRH